MKEKIEKQDVKKYSREKLLESSKFTSNQKSLIQALLEDKKKYSVEEVTKIIEDFLKREVK